MRTVWLFGGAAWFTASVIVVPAHAGLTGTAMDEVKAMAHQSIILESAATYRRCWRHYGRLVCRRYQYEYDLRSLPYGKRIWWEQYDRERGGRRR